MRIGMAEAMHICRKITEKAKFSPAECKIAFIIAVDT